MPHLGIKEASEAKVHQCDFGGPRLPSVWWAEALAALRGGWFAGIGPVEGMGQSVVEVFQEPSQFVLQVRHRGEVAATHHLPHHDSEDHFDLVEPRAVFGEKHEAEAMVGIRQEFAARRLGTQHARFPFFFPAADSARSVGQSTRPAWPTNAR